MTIKEILDSMVFALKNRNVDVHFVYSNKDGIEIGELKNGRITLNTKARDEMTLVFIIAHLFGHYCQFQNYDKYKFLIEEVEKPLPLTLSKEFRKAFWIYEKEAFEIGLSLMLEVFIVPEKMKKDYQIFMQTDFEHFWKYITTGKQESIEAFNKLLESNYKSNYEFHERLKPIPIPKLSIKNSKNANVVIY